MRFVSDVQRTRIDGSVEHLKSAQGYLNYELTMSVYDTDTRDVEFLAPCDCLDDSCFGFASVALADSCAVACHTEKTAMLYKYVVEAKTVRERSQVLNNADSCTIGVGQMSVTHVPGNTALDVHLVADSVLVEGKSGSVVCRQRAWQEDAEVLSLYDFLGYLCNALKTNVMQYELIQLYKAGKVCHNTTIRLLHTPESDRYFTKMYLDVLRR